MAEGKSLEVRRLFVEKQSEFAVEAKHLLEDLRDTLGLRQLQGVRIWNRYDVQGLDERAYARARDSIFSEPNVDLVTDEVLPTAADTRYFAMEYLPGQYDQRADSAAQCIQLLTQGERPRVASAKVIGIQGITDDADFQKIQDYLVNPVEARIASLKKPDTLDMPLPPPEKVSRVTGFIGYSDEQVAHYHAERSFAMTVADLCFCRNYFRDTEGRDPSITELMVIDTYWSDHCRHTTFLTTLDGVEIEKGPLSEAIQGAFQEYLQARQEIYADRERPMNLMDMATIGAKLLKKRGLIPDLDESDEINACSIQMEIEVDGKKEPWLIQFKNETHNHPTEIEPFGGAATCLGGAIRDPLSGRAYVYQAMRVTGSGDPRKPFEETLPHKLPQKKITTGAAQGYSSYGNQIGLSTGQVSEIYEEGYVAKRLEIGAVISASPKANVTRSVPQKDDVIVLLGGRTGRDGCGGATGSSKAHDESSVAECGAQVQKGNPPTERKLQRLFRDGAVSRLIKRCNDFGAGGVCVAIGELAPGLNIDLDKVPKKYEGLDGTELAISESQERMAVVLDPKDVPAFIEAAGRENLEGTPVATVTDEGRLTMFWQEDRIVDIRRDFLDTNGVTGHVKACIKSPESQGDVRGKVPDVLQDLSLSQAFVKNLSRLEVCSQKGLAERFDASIGAGTVLMPFAGKYQLTPEEAMCAKVPVLAGETDDATAMSYGFMPALSKWSPFHAAAFSVVEALSKLAAIGADPMAARLTMQEYFERLYEEPTRWGKPAAALLGALTAQLHLGLPSIGGKDSMSGSFNELDVPPTLVSFAVTRAKASKVISAALQGGASNVYLLPLPINAQTRLPDWELVKALWQRIYSLTQEGKILSAGVVREGGAGATLARMAFGNHIGFRFAPGLTHESLFAPWCGALVVEMADEAPLAGLEYRRLGQTVCDATFTIEDAVLPLETLIQSWTSPLEKVFPTTAKDAAMPVEAPLYWERQASVPTPITGKPRVLIPVFPGTNCEYDTARAFQKAGAEPEILVIRNLTAGEIEQSIAAFADALARCQILMLPGGFSGGDEPDGSGKFIATTLRNPRMAQGVMDLLTKRNGLILGICNGFQALVKLGLLPFGEIRDLKPTDPTLTFNNVARHVSTMAYTRITSVQSPWLRFVEPGDLHAVPVSHGEGRFVADPSTLGSLALNGQIATQYVDVQGKPASAMPFNPNGSVCAIEGITSPDGRIFGKMGHSERKGAHLYKNVPFAKDQQIFEAGVAYFK